MATDRGRGPASAPGAEGLFDVDQIPFAARDMRSVGEMLFDVDCLARQLLMDVTGNDAAGLLRGWPFLVTAAEQLWQALPKHPFDDESDRPIERLAAQAANVEATLALPRAWPGEGPADARMIEMADSLTTAAVLVRRYRAEIPQAADARRDIEAARARIMHGLYVTAHAAGVSLHAHGRDRYHDAGEGGKRVKLSGRHSAYAVRPVASWIDRLAASENAAHRYLTGRSTQAMAGESVRPIDDSARLPRAVAVWDIQAHRTLAGNPTPPNLVLITRTQGLIAGAGMVLIAAADRAGIHDPSERLTPAIAEAGRAWTSLANRWGDLVLPGSRHDTKLVHAAAEVRAAFRELTYDTTTLASADVIATRPGLDRATAATLQAVEAAAELAHVVAEKADNPNLTGPARALSIRANNDLEAGLATPNADDADVVWVAVADIQDNRAVPIPRPVAETLHAASAAAVDATTTASAVATAHSAASGPRHGDAAPQADVLRPREEHADRPAPRPSSAAPRP